MNQKGFLNIIIGILVAVVIIGGATGYYYISKNRSEPGPSPQVPKQTEPTSEPQPEKQPTVAPETKPKQVPATTPSLENTLEYKYYDKDIPFSFRYPKDYCWTQDIAAVIIHKPPFCGGNNAVNVKGSNLIVFAFPEEGIKTTEEYVNTKRLRNLQQTDEKRNIGGYSAIGLVDPQHPSTKIYAFLTNYEFKFPENMKVPNEVNQQHNKYGVIILSTLGSEPSGKEAEELILSTFIFQ